MTDFKVGDKVRTVGSAWAPEWLGVEGEIAGHFENGTPKFRAHGSEYIWGITDRWGAELVQAAYVAQEETNEVPDAINPAHYQGFSNGAQVIDITEHLTPNLANVVKYAARAGSKTPDPMEDLLKAHAYLNREINRLNGDPKW